MLLLFNQLWFKSAYSWVYLIVPVVYAVFQTVFCINIKTFFSTNDGVKYFFLYKGIKFFVAVAFILIYILVAKEVDKWLPIRVIVYYLAFLITETVISTRYQKKNN
ncbi:MAG: hypothetical protein MJ007_04480 [Paludibacteraceae bacterium]|nr:hypothetical protein [Paludibacteraceae bacterium]